MAAAGAAKQDLESKGSQDLDGGAAAGGGRTNNLTNNIIANHPVESNDTIIKRNYFSTQISTQSDGGGWPAIGAASARSRKKNGAEGLMRGGVRNRGHKIWYFPAGPGKKPKKKPN